MIINLINFGNFFNSSEVLDICYNFFYEKFLVIESEEYAKDNYKIIMSRTLNKLINIMKQRINKNDPNYISPESPKFLLYSGHDDTLTQMQIFLNKHFNINKEWVPYASNQIFELRKYGNIFYVEVYYNNRLKMNITFEQFEKVINNCFRKYLMSSRRGCLKVSIKEMWNLISTSFVVEQQYVKDIISINVIDNLN
jgi:hypothetical protein